MSRWLLPRLLPLLTAPALSLRSACEQRIRSRVLTIDRLSVHDRRRALDVSADPRRMGPSQKFSVLL
jgi:hypothetical protein